MILALLLALPFDCTTQWQLNLLLPQANAANTWTAVYISQDRDVVVAEKDRVKAAGWEWTWIGPTNERNESGLLARGWTITEWCCPGWPEPCMPVP